MFIGAVRSSLKGMKLTGYYACIIKKKRSHSNILITATNWYYRNVFVAKW